MKWAIKDLGILPGSYNIYALSFTNNNVAFTSDTDQFILIHMRLNGNKMGNKGGIYFA